MEGMLDTSEFSFLSFAMSKADVIQDQPFRCATMTTVLQR